MDLFEAIRFDKVEDRYTALFVAVLERLDPEHRARWLAGLPLEEVTRPLNAQLQTRGEESVPDALLLWAGELIVAVEVKLGSRGLYDQDQSRKHAQYILSHASGKGKASVAHVADNRRTPAA